MKKTIIISHSFLLEKKLPVIHFRRTNITGNRFLGNKNIILNKMKYPIEVDIPENKWNQTKFFDISCLSYRRYNCLIVIKINAILKWRIVSTLWFGICVHFHNFVYLPSTLYRKILDQTHFINVNKWRKIRKVHLFLIFCTSVSFQHPLIIRFVQIFTCTISLPNGIFVVIFPDSIIYILAISLWWEVILS